MKKAFKYVGLGFLGLIALLAAVFAVFYVQVEAKRSRPVKVTLSPIAIPTDEAAKKEGERLSVVKGCAECHGADFGGRMFIDDPAVGKFYATNLTTGKGSAVAEYQDADWDRAIRYGIGHDGLPLLAMPAGDFHGMSNSDLGKLLAYLKSIPPVDREREATKLGPMAYVLSGFGSFPLLFPFEEVDFQSTHVENVEAAVTVEYGKYISMACTGCHGPGFGGGQIPGTPPSWPPAANLTPKGRSAQWSYDQFKRVLSEGITPDGKQIDSQYMPWKSMAAMTDTEMRALHMYLSQVPAKEYGTR